MEICPYDRIVVQSMHSVLEPVKNVCTISLQDCSAIEDCTLPHPLQSIKAYQSRKPADMQLSHQVQLDHPPLCWSCLRNRCRWSLEYKPSRKYYEDQGSCEGRRGQNEASCWYRIKVCLHWWTSRLHQLDMETVSHNTKKFRLALPEEDQVSGLYIASARLTKF